MEAVAMMRALMRHPLLVGLGLALALVAGLSASTSCRSRRRS